LEHPQQDRFGGSAHIALEFIGRQSLELSQAGDLCSRSQSWENRFRLAKFLTTSGRVQDIGPFHGDTLIVFGFEDSQDSRLGIERDERLGSNDP
jgi:hypothetical protein